jgi:hypothetical protein
VHGVHLGLCEHKVLEVVLDSVGYFGLVALDLALDPETERRVVDPCLPSDIHLLDVVLGHDLLELVLQLLFMLKVVSLVHNNN